jgi:hypothetical protein
MNVKRSLWKRAYTRVTIAVGLTAVSAVTLSACKGFSVGANW